MVPKSSSPDFSNRAVLFMLFFVIILSVVSLLVYYHAISNVRSRVADAQAAALQIPRPATGEVTLRIIDPHSVKPQEDNKNR